MYASKTNPTHTKQAKYSLDKMQKALHREALEVVVVDCFYIAPFSTLEQTHRACM